MSRASPSVDRRPPRASGLRWLSSTCQARHPRSRSGSLVFALFGCPCRFAVERPQDLLDPAPGAPAAATGSFGDSTAAGGSLEGAARVVAVAGQRSEAQRRGGAGGVAPIVYVLPTEILEIRFLAFILPNQPHLFWQNSEGKNRLSFFVKKLHFVGYIRHCVHVHNYANRTCAQSPFGHIHSERNTIQFGIGHGFASLELIAQEQQWPYAKA